MSEVVCTKAQEEYEDDFEKDLDWLISEENQSEEQVSQASVCSGIFIRSMDRLIAFPLSAFCFTLLPHFIV